MELRYWWLSLLLFVVIAIGWGVVVLLRKKQQRQKSETRRPLANSWRLTRLPEYRALIHRQQWIARGVLAIIIVALFTTIVLAGRPATMTIDEPEMKNRDIMLCLDVSGSMHETNAKLTKIYADMAKDFDGERIGLTIFDSSPVMVFPLTNDYDFARTQLENVSKAFTGDEGGTIDFSFFDGAFEGEGSSLIGDGLAGCVNRFDQLGTKRSRSIIFGTDNYVSGSPIVTLLEAANFAKEKDIRVYGINPADYSSGNYTSDEAKEYKKAVLLTNGDYYKMDDASATTKVVQKIIAQEATRFKGSPQIIHTDQPQVFIYIITALLAIMYVIAWRTRS